MGALIQSPTLLTAVLKRVLAGRCRVGFLFPFCSPFGQKLWVVCGSVVRDNAYHHFCQQPTNHVCVSLEGMLEEGMPLWTTRHEKQAEK